MAQRKLDKKARALRAISAHAKRRSQLDDQELELIDQALEVGATWREVGEALGVTASAVHQRHSKRRR